MNIERLADTGLSKLELADLFGVTRVTVIHWTQRRFKPNEKIKDRVSDITNRLDEAIKQGKLPLPAGVSRHQRLPRLREIIGLTD